MTRALALTLTLFGTGLAPRAEAQRQPGWEVRIPDRIELTLGDTGTLPIAIAVDRGLAISRDAPLIVDLAVLSGLTLKKPRLGRADAVDPGADAPRFAISLVPTAAGEHTVTLRLRFWVCGGRVCRPLDLRRTTTVEVTASAPE